MSVKKERKDRKKTGIAAKRHKKRKKITKKCSSAFAEPMARQFFAAIPVP
jgi:hypothetical protein